ncbi:MAG TPA: ABC transporter permease [Candidatus Saccharimonadales bacterium]|nr:ABC transporter permease [Candidatus Saccharimonadales bacterium]
MINSIKAEFRKLLTVRSTYILTLLSLGFMVLLSFYAQAFSMTGGALKATLHDPNTLNNVIVNALSSLPLIFASIVAILLITHEYRYNTIMHSLTSANRRSKVLIGKIVVVSTYGLILTVVLAVLAPLLAQLGFVLHGHHLVAQNIPYSSLVWRGLFYGWTSVLAALVIGVVARSQVGAIVALFVIPSIEAIVGIFLKAKAVYLPFTGAQNAILSHPERGSLSYAKGALFFGLYLVIAWVIAWILFLKRDAN